MRTFEVYLNKKKLCRAGIGDDGVLTAMVNWITRKGEGDMLLEVGGLRFPVNEYVRWVDQKPLHLGDQIHIKVVEAGSVDRPIEKFRRDPSEVLRSKKRYVRMAAKELGWKIQARPR